MTNEDIKSTTRILPTNTKQPIDYNEQLVKIKEFRNKLIMNKYRKRLQRKEKEHDSLG